MLVSVRDCQRDERRDNLHLEACVRARVEPLDVYPLGLTVDRLNRATIGSDGQLVAPPTLRGLRGLSPMSHAPGGRPKAASWSGVRS